MKRDLDLYRAILLAVESASEDNWGSDLDPEEFPNHTTEVVRHHVALLEDAGYLEVIDHIVGNNIIDTGRITHSGYDFLDAVRDELVWKKTKNAAESVGSFSISVLKDVAIGLAKSSLSQHLGVVV